MSLRRLTYLHVGRLIIIGSLCVAGMFVLGTENVLVTYAIVGLVAVLYTPFSLLWMNRRPDSRAPVWTILLLDSLLLGVIVHLAGGVDGPMAVSMALPPLAAGLLLGQRGGLGVALECIVILTGSAWLEVNGIQVRFGSPLMAALRNKGEVLLTIRYAGLRTFVHACLLTSAGLISGYLSETLRKQAGRLQVVLDALRESQATADEILNSMTDGVVVVDTAGRPIRVNPAARLCLGLTGEDWKAGLRTSPVQGLLTDFLEKGSGPEQSDLSVGGRVLECRVSGFRNEQGDFSGAVAVFSDVTEVRSLRADLEEKEKMAVLGRLSATMAHEIRNPLASISGSIQLLRSKPLEAGGEERLMSLIVRESGRVSEILEGYLELARPARAFSRERIDLVALLEEALDLARRSMDDGGVELVLEAGARPVMEGSRARLTQVFGNLIRNAIEATEQRPDGRVVVRVGTEQYPGSGCDAVVRVVDNGCGIDPERLETIMDPFISSKDSGTGLGLYIARRAAEDHGGAISFESSPGRGTTVTVRLPLSHASKDTAT
ncbi:PAS domain-containing protein [Candidatus Fermentibacterales bacterium]|nr:PAS domain-containing protein [Candidatus Fermentibacterales bacterium]